MERPALAEPSSGRSSSSRTRIYRASRRGDVKTVHRLQRLLMTSWAARCLAVRRVTQDNRGKKTAGVDGVKNLPPRPAAPPRPHPDAHRPRRNRPAGSGSPNPARRSSARSASRPCGDRRRQTLAQARPGTGMGGSLRAQQLRVPPGALTATMRSKRICSGDLPEAEVRARRGHRQVLRPHRPDARCSPSSTPSRRLRRAIRAWLKAGVLDGRRAVPHRRGHAPRRGDLARSSPTSPCMASKPPSAPPSPASCRRGVCSPGSRR